MRFALLNMSRNRLLLITLGVLAALLVIALFIYVRAHRRPFLVVTADTLVLQDFPAGPAGRTAPIPVLTVILQVSRIRLLIFVIATKSRPSRSSWRRTSLAGSSPVRLPTSNALASTSSPGYPTPFRSVPRLHVHAHEALPHTVRQRGTTASIRTNQRDTLVSAQRTVLLVGTPGRTGRPALEQLPGSGINVRVIVRSAQGLPAGATEHPNPAVVETDLLALCDEATCGGTLAAAMPTSRVSVTR